MSKEQLPSHILLDCGQYYFKNNIIFIVCLGTYDFLSMNHYTSRLCTSGRDLRAKARYQDANFLAHEDKNWETGQVVWLKVRLFLFEIFF